MESEQVPAVANPCMSPLTGDSDAAAPFIVLGGMGSGEDGPAAVTADAITTVSAATMDANTKATTVDEVPDDVVNVYPKTNVDSEAAPAAAAIDGVAEATAEKAPAAAVDGVAAAAVDEVAEATAEGSTTAEESPAAAVDEVAEAEKAPKPKPDYYLQRVTVGSYAQYLRRTTPAGRFDVTVSKDISCEDARKVLRECERHMHHLSPENRKVLVDKTKELLRLRAAMDEMEAKLSNWNRTGGRRTTKANVRSDLDILRRHLKGEIPEGNGEEP